MTSLGTTVSQRDPDGRHVAETEPQRWAVHFEVARTARGWRMVGMQATRPTADALAATWFTSGQEATRG